MPAVKRLLVTGGSGFIGAALVREGLERGYQVAYTYASHSLPLPAQGYRVDYLDPSDESLAECLERERPEALVYSAVPSSIVQAGEEANRLVSAEGVIRTLEHLQKAAPEALFIYVSTNMVFGGGLGPYRESDQPDPEKRFDPYRYYGLTKAAGERLTLENWPNSLVARTCVVDGRLPDGRLSPRLAGLVESLKNGRTLARFEDRFFSPTLAENFCEALFETIQPAFTYRGILHLAGSEPTSDYLYGLYLARHLGLDEGLVQPDRLENSPAMRGSPPDTSLDVTFTQSLLRTRLLGVEEQLARLFDG